MALVVASVFLRVYLIGGVRVADHARLSEFVVVRSLCDDLSMAQREVAENQPMRVIEKLPVSSFVPSLFFFYIEADNSLPLDIHNQVFQLVEKGNEAFKESRFEESLRLKQPSGTKISPAMDSLQGGLIASCKIRRREAV
ncbi:hypothetical protein Bca52824_028635 [Brassica carinata]|uniref:Uncharacterized protein n=1 Tax=Brassica carinata TaxID=52824 RepID=A0A8X8AQG6_BRACI|nr:hypothetical protein Bca52824_028635 [Brassica carinata]